MKTIIIAGVSVNADKIDSLDYDTMMSMALKSTKYRSIIKAKELIAAELKEHGISKPDTATSKDTKSSGNSGKDNAGKKGKDSPKGS